MWGMNPTTLRQLKTDVNVSVEMLPMMYDNMDTIWIAREPEENISRKYFFPMQVKSVTVIWMATRALRLKVLNKANYVGSMSAWLSCTVIWDGHWVLVLVSAGLN